MFIKFTKMCKLAINMRNTTDKLPKERAELSRKAEETDVYNAIDRPSVTFAMREIMSGMSTPTVMHWAKLHHLARSMLQYPEERWDHECQRTPHMLEVLTDTDTNTEV